MLLTLADLCIRSVANTANLWDPLVLIDLPRTVIVQIAESLHPVDLEKCENSHLFKKLGISTEYIWRRLYCNKWSHQKILPYCWCPVSELTARNAEVVWRDQFWYQLFSQVLGEAAHFGLHQHDNWVWKKCLPTRCLSKYNLYLQPRNDSVEDFINLNKKYARCLQINQKVLCFLMENPNIFELFAEYVEYIKLDFVKGGATQDLCKLLSSLFVTKSVKGIGMFFCQLESRKSWQNVFTIKRPSSHDFNSLDCDIVSKRKTLSNSQEDMLKHSPDAVGYQCRVLDCRKELCEGDSKEISSGTSDLVTTSDKEKMKFLKNQSEDTANDIDIYEFDCVDDTSDNSIAGNLTSTAVQDSLYDEVYRESNKSAGLVETPVSLGELWQPGQNLAFRSLQHLVLDSSDCFKNCGIEFFAKALRICTNLVSLTLEELINMDMEDDKKLGQLANAIVEIVVNGKLRHLKVPMICFLLKTNFFQYLASVLGSKCCKCWSNGGMLQSLSLLYNIFISSDVLEIMAQALKDQCCCSQQKFGECSAKNPNSRKEFDNLENSPYLLCVADQMYGLRELVLNGFALGHGVQINNNGAESMAKALSWNSTLVFVKLTNCNFTTIGMSHIFRSMAGTNGYRGNKTLKILDLSLNSYRPDQDDGLEMLFRYSALSELNLANCDLKMLPEKLIEALGQNRSIINLGLADNMLGDEGVIALSKVFTSETRDLPLKNIDLSRNRITLESVKVLVRALHGWWPRRLEEINLCDNLLSSNSDNGTNAVKLSMLKPLVKSLIVNAVDQNSLCNIFSDYVSEM